jgi:kynurenine formamidase
VTEPDGRLPRYDELPVADRGGRSGWGLFGPDDSVGLLNQQTPESVLAATKLVRRGAVFPLDAALDGVDPPLIPRRGKPRHALIYPQAPMLGPGPFPGPALSGLDDVYDNFNPQTSSQWDSLAHAAYSPGVFYNGATENDVLAGRRNTIDYWARQGIVARAVVLDLARVLPAAGREYRPPLGTAFTPADLELAREVAGVSYSPGCVVLLHTGFLGWYQEQPYADRADFVQNLRAPGVEHTEEMARYLWDSGLMAIASDTFSVEVWPPDRRPEAFPFGFLHRVLIGQFGMALGELWQLGDLAADCADDGVYECLLTSAPLNGRGGIASPPNALAIK